MRKLRREIKIDEIERNPKWIKMDITGKEICDLEIPKEKMYVLDDDDDDDDFFKTNLTETKRKTFEDT